ncbi:hypothetical protein, partial [Anoxybacillus sp. KU2-6(11)]|uniref:hypothetical protein n=1 Tax=Anoxybacillus sp. KU2-6(11) TaxID=1535751 RepID=UPI000507054E
MNKIWRVKRLRAQRKMESSYPSQQETQVISLTDLAIHSLRILISGLFGAPGLAANALQVAATGNERYLYETFVNVGSYLLHNLQTYNFQ